MVGCGNTKWWSNRIPQLKCKYSACTFWAFFLFSLGQQINGMRNTSISGVESCCNTLANSIYNDYQSDIDSLHPTRILP